MRPRGRCSNAREGKKSAAHRTRRTAGKTEKPERVSKKGSPLTGGRAEVGRAKDEGRRAQKGSGEFALERGKEAARGPFFGRIYRSPIVREFERLNHRNFISVRPRNITVRSAVARDFASGPDRHRRRPESLPFLLGREPSGIRGSAVSLIGQGESSLDINGAFDEERERKKSDDSTANQLIQFDTESDSPSCDASTLRVIAFIYYGRKRRAFARSWIRSEIDFGNRDLSYKVGL